MQWSNKEKGTKFLRLAWMGLKRERRRNRASASNHRRRLEPSRRLKRHPFQSRRRRKTETLLMWASDDRNRGPRARPGFRHQGGFLTSFQKQNPMMSLLVLTQSRLWHRFGFEYIPCPICGISRRDCPGRIELAIWHMRRKQTSGGPSSVVQE